MYFRNQIVKEDESFHYLKRETALNLYNFYKLCTKTEHPIQWRVFSEAYYFEKILTDKGRLYLGEVFSTSLKRAFTWAQFTKIYGFKSDSLGLGKVVEDEEFQVLMC